MICTNCGSALMQPSTFCSTCGQLITPAAHPAVVPSAWPPAPAPAPGLDAAGQFPRPSYDQYPPSDDDTVEFPAIRVDRPPMSPAYAATMATYDTYAPAPGYSPPPSPQPQYGPPVSPAVGYNSPVSPYVGYGQPVPAYAQQAAYAPERSYAETYRPTPDYGSGEGFGAPGQPYAGAPAGYDQPAPAAYDQPAAYAEPSPADYHQPTGYGGYGEPIPAGHSEPTQAAYDEPFPAEYGQPAADPNQIQPDHQPHVYGTPTEPPDNRLSTMAFVLAGLAVLILPCILGLAAIVVSNKAAKHGERLAPLAFQVSLAGTAIGCIISGVVLWLL